MGTKTHASWDMLIALEGTSPRFNLHLIFINFNRTSTSRSTHGSTTRCVGARCRHVRVEEKVKAQLVKSGLVLASTVPVDRSWLSCACPRAHLSDARQWHSEAKSVCGSVASFRGQGSHTLQCRSSACGKEERHARERRQGRAGAVARARPYEDQLMKPTPPCSSDPSGAGR
jgi:hypothetical protein